MTKEHRIIREVRHLAAENPDFVYAPPMRLYPDGEWAEGDTCVYVHEGRGSCLFGQAMMKTGDLTADIDADDNEISIDRLLEKLPVRIPPEQALWAKLVQGAQDSGKAWGQAVAEADEEIEVFA